MKFHSQNRIFSLLRRALRDGYSTKRSCHFYRQQYHFRAQHDPRSSSTSSKVWYARPSACRAGLQSLSLLNRCYEGPSVSLGMECVCTDSKPYSVPWCFLYRGSGPPRNASRHSRIDVCPWYGQRIDARAPSPSFRPESTREIRCYALI